MVKTFRDFKKKIRQIPINQNSNYKLYTYKEINDSYMCQDCVWCCDATTENIPE